MMPDQPKQQATILTAVPDEPASHQQPTEENPSLVVEDLLVEDVSIDGMCGVY